MDPRSALFGIHSAAEASIFLGGIFLLSWELTKFLYNRYRLHQFHKRSQGQ